MQEDDSQTVSEPTVIMTGNPEGKDNVRSLLYNVEWKASNSGSRILPDLHAPISNA